MKRLIDFFKSRFSKKDADESMDVQALRIAFKERYHHFKLLLNANNSALETMTAIEQALQGRQPFGMSFIRSNCIAVTVSLMRLLKHLEQLSDGKYNKLYGRYDAIWHEISALIEQKKEVADQRLIIPLSGVDRTMADQVGNKMANLGEIRNKIGLQVPAGFVITSRAYDHFIEHNDLQNDIDALFIATDITDMKALHELSTQIRERIVQAPVPPDLEEQILAACRSLEKEVEQPISMALRSSALGEDSANHSFAGQYRSELNVPAADVIQKYKEVLAGKYSMTAITYRLNKGIRDEEIAMSVGCLTMLDARCGGVMYTRNPLDIGDDAVFINSAWGLPKAVVDGSVDCDLFIVSRKEPKKITFRDIKEKSSQYLCFSDTGVCRLEITGESGSAPSLQDQEAIRLSELALSMEQYYGSPQDIEWAISREGTIYMLQCRPLQQMDTLKMDYPEERIRQAGKNVIASGGTIICPGVAAGEVFVMQSPQDAIHFPEGGVLVARQALPAWAALLSRAVAVITEYGTFAGHLANVAREFKVPAIFGLQGIATQLKNGDKVTVDANRARVYGGIVEISRPSPPSPPKMIEGSPVYNLLRDISRYILPLNLLDPYSSRFKADNCRTFHDITRFAHEKSVEEMFNFGKKHNFSERSSKQLHYKVPMQWWILNLDDGFKEGAGQGKYVRLEEIVSVPMRAIWEGFVAVPWDGPPPIDNRGLASVMFGSTTNRELVPYMRTGYLERNYFIISKHFCSLTSRLGYHFSIIEALVSERVTENYISFRFKGGAADDQRRVRRIRFIADILAHHGFRITLDGDNLVSRIEGFEMPYMLERLKVLGYLILHTRQLDMIMSNEKAIAYYWKKIDKDIKGTVLAG